MSHDERFNSISVILLFQEVFSIDVSEAAEERQRTQSVRVCDPDVTRHPLDQPRETLQLCHDVI